MLAIVVADSGASIKMGTYGKETKIHMKGRQEVMSESKAVVTNGWSALNTVDEFDNGLSNSSENILTANDDISKKIMKSLFVESVIDQLCKLLEKDPKKGHKLYEGICSKLYKMQLIEDTYHIEELASLRSHFQQALLDVMVKPDARLYSAPLIKLGSSRYATEYEEICFLDSGGFGQVFKAKNRLDQVIYAVKKISLRYQNVQTFARKLNEVKTLAKLNHPNIVQYKAAWLEPTFNMKPSITPVEVANISTTDSDIVVFQSNSSNNQVKQEEKEQNKNLEMCKYQRGGSVQRSVPEVWALLYVSMQLCDETLSEWLYNRNSCHEPLDVPLVLNIITQAVAGVEYIHSCNIVHHDIKPRNIFLSSDLKSVHVGDFGLSCCLQGHDHLHCPLEGGQFGTPLYAAPEQLKGRCDPKSDMFSLGLVFIEVFTIFSTEMERVKVLTEARSGHLPCSIPLPLIPIIRALISHNLDDRPTASELLTKLHKLKVTDFNEAEDTATAGTTAEVIGDGISSVPDGEDMDKLLKDKDREIVQLRQMLAQRENEIAELKHFLSKNST